MRLLRVILTVGYVTAMGCGDAPGTGEEQHEPGVLAPAEDDTEGDDDFDVIVVDNHPTVDVPAGALSFGGAGGESKVVVGAENRKPITDTSSPPFSSVVLLWASFPNSKPGFVSACTGTLIAEDAVLTSAHCVYNTMLGGRAKSVRVLPGAYASGNLQSALPAIGESGIRNMYVPDEYDDTAGYTYDLVQYDYAVLRLKKPLGKLAGYRDYGTLEQPIGRFAQMFAYHGDLCSGATGTTACRGRPSTMHQSDDKIRRVLGAVANHYIDMTPGASGAGITSDGAEFGRVFAINAAENSSPKYNLALLLTPAIVADIQHQVQTL